MMPAGQPGRHLDIFAKSARPYFLPAILSSGFPVDLGKNFRAHLMCIDVSKLSLDDFATIPDPVDEATRVNPQFVVAHFRQNPVVEKDRLIEFSSIADRVCHKTDSCRQSLPVGHQNASAAPAREHDILSFGTGPFESVP